MWILLILQFFTGLVTGPVFTFFPVYLQDIGYSAVLISGIVTLNRVIGFGSAIAGGTLSDVVGPKHTLLIGQILFFTGTLLFLTGSPVLVSVVWAACGFGMGLNMLGGQSYLLDRAGRRSLGVITALYYWGATLGGAISSPVAGFLFGRVGYRGLSPFMIIPAVATVFATFFALPASHSRRKRPVPSARKFLSGFFGYQDIATRPTVLMLAALRFLPTFCYGMMAVFVPLTLKSAGASNQTIALYATASSVCAALCQLIVGRIADTLSWKAPTAVAYVALAASSLSVGCFPGSLLGVFAFATVGIAAAWSLSTLLPTLVAKVTGTTERGRVLGYVHLFWNAGMILSSLSGGFLFEAWKGLPFLVGGIVSACAIVLAPIFFRKAEPAAAQSPR